jgi:hypothetical protein
MRSVSPLVRLWARILEFVCLCQRVWFFPTWRHTTYNRPFGSWPGVLTQALKRMIYIEVTNSNSDWVFSWFPWVHLGKFRDIKVVCKISLSVCDLKLVTYIVTSSLKITRFYNRCTMGTEMAIRVISGHLHP